MFRLSLYAFLVFNFIALLTTQMLGPVDLNYKKIEQCDPPINNVDFWVKKWKVNRTTENLNITLNTPFAIDDSLLVTMNASMKKEGGWKPGALFYENTLCKAFENMLGDTFLEIISQTGHEKCPLPEGSYAVNNYFLNNAHFTVPQVFGEYRMEITISKVIDDEPDPVVEGCYVIYYDFNSKRDSKIL